MIKKLINTRVEFDQDIDSGLRKIAVVEDRPKKQALELIATRVIKLFQQDPQEAQRLGLVKPALQ